MSSKGLPQKVFLIGAQKSGTTSLAALLRKHPDICVSDPKEPHYFSFNFDKGFDWYEKCFGPLGAKIILDASTSYSMAPDSNTLRSKADPAFAAVAGRIYAACPDAKFIYIVREPVSRAYSAYWHLKRAGFVKGPFSEEANDGSVILRTGKYHFQISRFLKYFPQSSFLVLSFESFAANEDAVTRSCLRFLDLPDHHIEFTLTAPKNAAVRFNTMGRVLNKTGLIELLAPVSPSRLKLLARKLITSKIPPMPEADRQRLIEYYVPENKMLYDLLEMERPLWSY